MTQKLKVAILGTGNLGTDLLVKVLRSKVLDCTHFVGRNLDSPGLAKAMGLGVRVSDRSIQAIVEQPEVCDLVFDCTSAAAHERHWPILRGLGKVVIDLTPARLGKMCVPAVNLESCLEAQNLNMITCGGQTSIPMAYAIRQTHPEVDYVEVVSSIASRSAGPATRINLDEYVDTTRQAIESFTGCKRAKAILILNPAIPCVDMRTTISALVKDPDLPRLTLAVTRMVEAISAYVPGYRLVAGPLIDRNRIVVMLKVEGMGDYLPRYAGNLDIITCAAVAVAEALARRRLANLSE